MKIMAHGLRVEFPLKYNEMAWCEWGLIHLPLLVQQKLHRAFKHLLEVQAPHVYLQQVCSGISCSLATIVKKCILCGIVYFLFLQRSSVRKCSLLCFPIPLGKKKDIPMYAAMIEDIMTHFFGLCQVNGALLIYLTYTLGAFT